MLSIKSKLGSLKSSTWQISSFVLLLVIVLFLKAVIIVANNKHVSIDKREHLLTWGGQTLEKAKRILDSGRQGTISRIELIEIALRNMRAKRTRTIVTIGGMTIGIAAIVFLVSIGYGLEQLVISRVARLDEMRQADVVPQPGGKVKINDKTISDLKALPNVSDVLPVIAVVGRVNFQNSVSDMAVYGVTTSYLQQSAIKTSRGKIFDSNNLVTVLPTNGEVAGAETEVPLVAAGNTIQDVNFTIDPTQWIKVRENPTTSAKIIGYTKRSEGIQSGTEVWGSAYQTDTAPNPGQSARDVSGKWVGRWIKSTVFLWEKTPDGSYKVLTEAGETNQLQKEGYFAEINLSVTGVTTTPTKVLGASIVAGQVLSASDSSSIDFVDIASESGVIAPPETKHIDLGPQAVKQAVINRAALKILGINEADALGKTFQASFIVVGDLLDAKENVESNPTDYTIVGVVPDDKTPVFYVPFIDLRTLGITNYSQIKIVAKDQGSLPKIRRQIESMGYSTSSVADTVAQINNLFSTARSVLALLGLVALGVAALGMFNTLTVSLLERTREVGLMKAMGMRSSEVKELFLTESMIMGFFGGVMGLIVGSLFGKILGLIISIFTVFKGAGFVDISYIPLPFTAIIVVLSLSVGVLTGTYPAKLATKISALNALRYE